MNATNPDDSFGFGVVFSDETLGEFLKRDMQSYELIRSNLLIGMILL
jgi:anthraniloyl-CoA monooxygenase